VIFFIFESNLSKTEKEKTLSDKKLSLMPVLIFIFIFLFALAIFFLYLAISGGFSGAASTFAFLYIILAVPSIVGVVVSIKSWKEGIRKKKYGGKDFSYLLKTKGEIYYLFNHLWSKPRGRYSTDYFLSVTALTSEDINKVVYLCNSDYTIKEDGYRPEKSWLIPLKQVRKTYLYDTVGARKIILYVSYQPESRRRLKFFEIDGPEKELFNFEKAIHQTMRQLSRENLQIIPPERTFNINKYDINDLEIYLEKTPPYQITQLEISSQTCPRCRAQITTTGEYCPSCGNKIK
jgi:hypothetical protein